VLDDALEFLQPNQLAPLERRFPDTFTVLPTAAFDVALVIVHDQDKWQVLNGAVINIFSSPAEEALAAKIKKAGKPLEFYFNINVGIKPYQTGKGTPSQTKKMVEERPFDSTTRLTSEYRQYPAASKMAVA
jgi:glutamine synthetase